MAGRTRTTDRRERDGAPAARPSPDPDGARHRTPSPDDGTPPSGAEGEGERRRGPRLPGRRLSVALLALVLALGSFGVWALYGSSWLRVEEVPVQGARVLTEEQVRRVAAVPVGAPLLSVDTERAERRLREGLPRIEEAGVERSWPHGISVVVTERKPVLAMEKAGKYVEVDAAGVRFATVGEVPKGVPLLVMEPRKSPGLRHFGRDRLRRAAASVAADLPSGVVGDTRTIRVRSYDAITVELTDGRSVLWGSGERGTAKAKSLTALMKAEKDARHFDVSVPSAPAAAGS